MVNNKIVKMSDRPRLDMRSHSLFLLKTPSQSCCDKNDGLKFSQKSLDAIDMNSSVKIKQSKLPNIFSSHLQFCGSFPRKFD